MRTPYKARLLTGLTLLISGGCCTPYPNYPYGGGGYMAPPGMTVPPAIVTPPGGTLGPGSASPSGNLGAGNPSSKYSGQSPLNGNQIPQTAGGTSSGRGTIDKPVPNYRDPNQPTASDQPTAPSPRRTSPEKEISPFDDSNGTSTDSPRHRGVAAESDRTPATLTGSSGGDFEPPIRQTAGEVREGGIDDRGDGQSASTPSDSAESQAKSQPNPYGHDRENYRWLRGVVDFDAQDKSWYIIYDTAPDRADQYGGGFTLTGRDQFVTLHDQDVVLVRGEIDFDHHDRSGKPVYRIDHINRLIPQAEVSRARPLANPKTDRKNTAGGPRVFDGVVGRLER